MDIALINTLFLLLLKAVTPKPMDVDEKLTTTENYTEVSQDPEHLENLLPAKYQVTEYVIDIPDDRPLPGPLTFNYTSKKPLNVATRPNTIVIENTVQTETENNDLKRNKLSILHINADYDEQMNNNDNNSLFKGIKKYFHGIKKEIVNGIHNWFSKNKNTENFS